MKRRAFFAGLAGAATAVAGTRTARAMGRTPLGGSVTMHVPWSTASLDPHELRDPMGALFGSAAFDTLFAVDDRGQPYPTLASGMPSREAGETVVHLREGIHTARGVALDNRDVVFSIERARARAAGALFAELPRAMLRRGDASGVVFGSADPHEVAKALACPLAALVPRRFDPTNPDGTGAFRADVAASGLVLRRNPNAARGASFLDEIAAGSAPDLQTSLRAFEAEQDDLGWLGMGLHDERKGAVRFDVGRVAWAALVIGADVGPAATPGEAQRIADAIPLARLAHLGLGGLGPGTGDPSWSGAPAELTVDESAPHLIEIARSVASALSNPGHEVTLRTLPRAELARRRARGALALAVELVRPLGPSLHHAQIALASAEDAARGRDVAKIPLRASGSSSARSVTGLLRVGVIGEIRIHGGVVPDLALARFAEGWDLGASYRRLGKRP